MKTIQREVMILYFIKKSFAENPKLLRLRQAPRSNFKSNGGSAYLRIGVIWKSTECLEWRNKTKSLKGVTKFVALNNY